MISPLTPTALVQKPSRVRSSTFVALGVSIAALLAALVVVLVQVTFTSALSPFVPTAADGHVRDGQALTLADDDVPAIARMDAALLAALRAAEADAAADGIAFQVTSGWRSERYQRWLLDEAVRTYGSEAVAREFVATPEKSRHVTGDAVDIGPLDAQFWLIEHGAAWGICQTYANERWHFELATEPGGVCPEMKRDATF